MNNKYDIALGFIFSVRRKELGLSQQDVADHFKISKSLICRYEQGGRSMNASTFFDFCDYYKVKADDIAKEVRKIADEV